MLDEKASNVVGCRGRDAGHGMVYVSSPAGVASPSSLFVMFDEATGGYRGRSATVPANGGVVVGPGPGVNYVSVWH